MPLFSIVVPAYNAESTLAETLEAVLAQQNSDWECIVVDDGSVDGTRALAESFATRDSRIRVVCQPNSGTAGAYNAGVREARGDYIVLCSADDILLPEHLTRMQAFIEAHTGDSIFSTNGYYLRPNGSREMVYSAGEIAESLALADVIRNCFYSVGAAYRRELFGGVGGYRTEVFGEDYDFWLRTMAQGAKHRYLPQPLSLHRLSASQKSANLENALESDIRLLEDLRASYALSAEEVAALDETVQARRQRIASLRDESPMASLRRATAALAIRVLGARRVRRLAAAARAAAGRGRHDGHGGA